MPSPSVLFDDEIPRAPMIEPGEIDEKKFWAMLDKALTRVADRA